MLGSEEIEQSYFVNTKSLLNRYAFYLCVVEKDETDGQDFVCK